MHFSHIILNICCIEALEASGNENLLKLHQKKRKKKYSIDIQLCYKVKLSVAEVNHLSALQPSLHAGSLYCWLLRRAWRLERCLRGAHSLHHMLGATSTFLQISSWWGNTHPVFFLKAEGDWSQFSEINVKEMEGSASQKWQNPRNSDKKTAIYFCIKSVIYSTMTSSTI